MQRPPLLLLPESLFLSCQYIVQPASWTVALGICMWSQVLAIVIMQQSQIKRIAAICSSSSSILWFPDLALVRKILCKASSLLFPIPLPVSSVAKSKNNPRRPWCSCYVLRSVMRTEIHLLWIAYTENHNQLSPNDCKHILQYKSWHTDAKTMCQEYDSETLCQEILYISRSNWWHSKNDVVQNTHTLKGVFRHRTRI